MIKRQAIRTLLKSLAIGTLLVSIPSWAEERVLLDFNMKTPPPADWAVEGYAFGTHNPTPGERHKQALGTRNQRYVQKGRMTSPSSRSNRTT